MNVKFSLISKNWYLQLEIVIHCNLIICNKMHISCNFSPTHPIFYNWSGQNWFKLTTSISRLKLPLLPLLLLHLLLLLVPLLTQPPASCFPHLSRHSCIIVKPASRSLAKEVGWHILTNTGLNILHEQLKRAHCMSQAFFVWLVEPCLVSRTLSG